MSPCTGVALQVYDNLGNPLLHYAFISDSLECFKALLAAGADKSAPNLKRQTLMQMVAMSSQTERWPLYADLLVAAQLDEVHGKMTLLGSKEEQTPDCRHLQTSTSSCDGGGLVSDALGAAAHGGNLSAVKELLGSGMQLVQSTAMQYRPNECCKTARRAHALPGNAILVWKH